jgi:hypothetical protein
MQVNTFKARIMSSYEHNSANSYTQKSVGPDPGFGSSAFGVCNTELRDGIVNVLHA